MKIQQEVHLCLSPYNLQVSGYDFYPTLSRFAVHFLELAKSCLEDVLEEHAIMQVSLGAPARSIGEYAIELLTLGLLRQEYGGLAMDTPSEWIERLAALWEIRTEDAARKSQADAERAQIFRDILDLPTSTERHVDDWKLVNWLSSTGEFTQEAKRIQTWLDIADVLWSKQELYSASESLAKWFVPEARQRLGPWTAHTSDYSAQMRASAGQREDLFLITRSESLYHLNMLGSEVMNRGFAPEFHNRPRKIVLVPGCMRARPEKVCRAHVQGLDITCTHCTLDCQVSQLDSRGKVQGFQVYIVPHASSFTAWLKHWRRDTTVGLVAAACPLHLVPGGYEMRALGLAAQCVLLEFSGCKRHWDPRGRPTRLDAKRLESVLDGGGATP